MMLSRNSNALIHVGMPKCGSSSLQTMLSRNSELVCSKGHKYLYAAFNAEADLLKQNELEDTLIRLPHGYISSCSAKIISGFKKSQIDNLRCEIHKLEAQKIKILFSNEGWAREHHCFLNTDLFEKLGLRADIIFYVRPQVKWINSAWWQWGAWTNAKFARWIDVNIKNTLWTDIIERWEALPGVNNVIVKVLSKDILSDYLQMIGITNVKNFSIKANTSLPGEVLRLFQRHRDLRSGPHKSSADFIIERCLSFKESPTPWVLNKKNIENILFLTRSSNQKLLKYLDDKDKENVLNDLSWWSIEAYADKVLEDAGLCDPIAEISDSLAAEAVRTIIKMDRKNRKLLSEINYLKSLIKKKRENRKLLSEINYIKSLIKKIKF